MNKNRRKKIQEEISILFTQKKMNGGAEEIQNKNKNRRRKRAKEILKRGRINLK